MWKSVTGVPLIMRRDAGTHRLYRRVLVSVFLFSIPILKYHSAQSGTVNDKGLTRVCCVMMRIVAAAKLGLQRFHMQK